MKKTVALLLAVFFVTSILFACGSEQPSESSSEAVTASESSNPLQELTREPSEALSEDLSRPESEADRPGESSDTDSEEDPSSDSPAESSAAETPSETPSVSEETSETTDEPSSDDVSEPEESSEISEEPVEPMQKTAKVYIETSGYINRNEYVTCRIRIVDPTGKYEEIDDAEATIKIRGNSTSSGAKKPYNIKFSSKEDVLGMGKCKKWCLLANMYDKTLMRNKLAYDFAAAIGLAYTQQSTFADLYLNGKYMGNYQICESIGVGDTRVDIDTKGNEFLLEYEPREGYSNPQWIWTPLMGKLYGFNDPEEPTAEQRAWLTQFFIDAENALYSGDRARIEQYWDIDSFVNDYIVHEFFKNVDAQTSSTRYYIKGGKIYGGPVWDFDLSSGNCDSSYYKGYFPGGNSSNGWYCRHIWYDDLLVTGWFEELVIKRFRELQPIIMNLTFDNELGKNRIDLLLEEYGGSFRANFKEAGWSVTSKDSPYERIPLSTYEENVQFLRNWFIRRNNWMRAQFGI